MTVRSVSKSLFALLLLDLSLLARDAVTTIRIPSVALEVQIVLDERRMNREEMIVECEAILNRSGDFAFIRIQFADSHSVFNLPQILPTGASERGIWALEKRKRNAIDLRYAEFISVRGNAVLRIRDGLEIKMIVVRGKNPLLLSYKGAHAEFVHLGLKYDYRKTKVGWIDASAVVPKGGLDGELAKHVVRIAQEAMNLNLGANVMIREDRFCVFVPQFAHNLLFDLDSPPGLEQWSQTPSAECSVGRLGSGYCSAYRLSQVLWQTIVF